MSALVDNDIGELMEKVNMGVVLRLGFGNVTVNEVRNIIDKMGKAVIDVGDGVTLLHVAAQYNHWEMIQYLCEEKNHPLELKTRVGETALDQAAWRGHIDAAVLLIKYGADVDCQTGGLYTPLHRCAFYYHPRLASLLCLAGASRTLRDENNQTAYEVAVTKGHHDIAKVIKPLENEETTGGPYSSNNPKHPNFRPEAREAFFNLWEMEQKLRAEEEEGDEDDEGDWEDIDDDADVNEEEEEEEERGEEEVFDDDESKEESENDPDAEPDVEADPDP